jgi:hypothetical protein
MAVLSYREVLPRTLSHKFGEAPTAELKYVCTLDGATNTQDIINTVGIFHGAAHPEFSYLLCLNVAVSETDAFHAEVTYSFESPQEGIQEFQSSPLARADIWSFSTSGISVPCFRYYNGNGNNDIKPLVNSAGDIIEGAQTIEGELKLSIAGNRATFPIANAVAVTGALNSDSFLGAAAYQWMCHGISGQPAVEVVNGQEVNFWQVTAELSFKASGYQLYLPNVGWNYLDNTSDPPGKKTRVFVRDENGEKIAASSVQALDEDGRLKLEVFDISDNRGVPSIFSRRVNPAVAFAQYFGTPPF